MKAFFALCRHLLPASLLLSPLVQAQEVVWTSGVTAKVYDIQEAMDRVFELVPNQTPNVDQVRPTIDFANGAFVDPTIGQDFADYFVVEISGEVYAATSGTYTFELESDDGSILYFNEEVVCDNDGAHGPETVSGTRYLEAGWHEFNIDAFNDVGDFKLQLRWKQPGQSNASIIPQFSLRTDNNVVRVIAPGKKFILNNGDLSPGTGLPLEGVHPSWELATIRPDDFEPQVGAMTLANASTLYLGTFEPNQQDDTSYAEKAKVWRVDNVNGDPANVTYTQVAGYQLGGTTFLNAITGLEWFNGELFLAERTGIFRMIDDNGDGLFEDKELIGDSWDWDNFHQFPFCLKHRTEADGDYLYGALSVAISLGGNSDSNRDDFRGSVFRLKIPSRGQRNDVEYLAGGFRTPNGVGFGPDNGVFVTDNQGAWNPSNSLVHVVPGRFYGHFNPTDVFPPPADFSAVSGRFENQPISPKTVHFPQNEVSNSPTDILELEEGPFTGQLLVGELTAGGIRRVFLEEVGGEFQGALFRHSQGFEAGVNRLRLSNDGSIYVGCMGSNGGWSYQDLVYGLQRMQPKADAPTVFEIKTVKALQNGIEVEFTKSVPNALLANFDSYFVQQWRYLPTENYGGPKIDLKQLPVSATSPSRAIAHAFNSLFLAWKPDTSSTSAREFATMRAKTFGAAKRGIP